MTNETMPLEMLDEEALEADVYNAMRFGWSQKEARRLKREHGVSLARLQAVRLSILRAEANDLRNTPRAEQFAEWLLKVRHAYVVAMVRNDTNTAARLLSLEGRALGFDKLTVDLSSSDQPPVLSPAELVARRAELARKIGLLSEPDDDADSDHEPPRLAVAR